MSLSLTFQKEYKEWYIHNFAGIEERGNLSPCFALIPMKLCNYTSFSFFSTLCGKLCRGKEIHRNKSSGYTPE